MSGKNGISRRDLIKNSTISFAAAAMCPPALVNIPDAFGISPQQQPLGMFCYQCEQTANGTGCTKLGVCGKKPDVAALHDLLIHALKGLSVVAVAARKKGIEDVEVNRFVPAATFSTLTNVDFDPKRFVALIQKTVELRDRLKDKAALTPEALPVTGAAVTFKPASGLDSLIRQGAEVGLKSDTAGIDPDVLSLKHILQFGLKGISAYTHHAQLLGQEDNQVYGFIQDGLVAVLDKKLGLEAMLGVVLKCGEMNLRAMELLDAGNTSRYGHPVPTKVPLGAKKGKAIAISGHDLIDLEQLLIQSAGKGINVYTHGEMLPAHGYPKLKKYSHLYGHYGTAWQNQQKEFANFPGAILMTTG